MQAPCLPAGRQTIAGTVTAHLKEVNRDFIPLALSILLALVSLLAVFIWDYRINSSHYFGFGFLVVSLVLYFPNKKVYILLFALALVLGLFSLIDFFFISFKFEFGVFGINPLFLVLLFIFFAFSKDTLNDLFPDSKSQNQKNVL